MGESRACSDTSTGLTAFFDLVCDVATFIGRPEHRQRAMARLLGVIEQLRARAAGAEIVVVGHSLGSVLVTHAFRELPSHGPPSSVVTLGSPLGLLARVFPSVITAPAELAASLRSSGRLSLWMNFWRDWDLIGRRLPGRQAVLVQQSLGDGPHSNYWREAKLWEMFIRVFDAPAMTPKEVRSRVERADLYPEEVRETRRSRRAHALLVANGLGALVGLLTLHSGCAVRGLERVLDGDVTRALAGVWWVVGLAVALAVVAARPFLFPPAAERDVLETFRYWRRPAILIWLVWLAFCGLGVWRIAVLVQRLGNLPI